MSQRAPDAAQAPASLPEQTPEDHRAFVREIDRAYALNYSLGGLAVLVCTLLWVAAGYFLGRAEFAIYAITTALLILAQVRRRLRLARPALQERLQEFCRLNALDPRELAQHYRPHNTYPFFVELAEGLETTPASPQM